MSEGIKYDSDALDRHITGNYGEDQSSREKPTQTLWEWLEEPEDYPVGSGLLGTLHLPLADFYGWGLNYDMSTSPFNLFRDLVGWSEDNIGGSLYDFSEQCLGYMEADYLADALKLWADMPQAVGAWLDKLSELELADYDTNG